MQGPDLRADSDGRGSDGTLPNGSKAKMHVSYGPDTDPAQDASLESKGTRTES